MSDQEPLLLTVGRVVKPHGVQGELVVEIRTDSPERRFAPGSVLGARRRGQSRPGGFTVAAARPHTGRLLVRAEGVETREAAEDLRGAFLEIRADELEEAADPEEFHDHQLEGLRAVRATGEQVGVVREMVHTPAGELLVVVTEQAQELLVPFVAEIVPEVDVAGGRVVVDPPDGLFDEA